MTAKRQKSDLQVCKEGVLDNLARWKKIRDYGCNDPFWPDGCNMNLCRNHMIHYKHRIREICEADGQPLPEEYYCPLPPKVSDYYMAKASMKQTRRVEQIRRYEQRSFYTGKIPYNETQLSLF